MKRKEFLHSSTAILAATALPSLARGGSSHLAEPIAIIPAYLRPGDTIAITSPAGYITLPEIKPAVSLIESWGYKVKAGTTIGKRDYTLGGTDKERKDDLQQLLDDRGVKAILCARGGYGSVRVIDGLNWNKFKQHPKWIIGFSDITVLHSHLNRTMGIASIHSKMCNSFPDDWAKADPVQVETILSIRKALSGETMEYTALPHVQNKPGIAEGVLVGGNLKTLESLAGSPSDIHTAGKLLFVEDTGEYLYSIDRMFWNLKRSGKLAELKGLIVGGFKEKKEDSGDEFGKTLQEIILEKVKEYDYPVCFDFPVGHQKNNFALKCGIRHRLQVQKDNVLLREI